MAKGKLSALGQGDGPGPQEADSGAAVRALQVVDHARVKQSLKQGHGFFVRQFAVLVADDVGGEVHARMIPQVAAPVKGLERKSFFSFPVFSLLTPALVLWYNGGGHAR